MREASAAHELHQAELSSTRTAYETAKKELADARAKGVNSDALVTAEKEALSKLRQHSEAKFGELSSFSQRRQAELWANFGKANKSVGNKILRAGSAAVGCILIGKGVKDFVSPKRDEEGNRTTGFFVPAVEAVGGAALVWAGLLAGGRNNAHNIHI